jgi:RNA polymerase sigma-70 factor, ECF subfamily
MEEAIAAPESEAMTPPTSFEAFFEEHRQEVFSAVWMIVRDRQETEDLVQEAFVKVLERWDRFGDVLDPTAYTIRMAVNAWLSRRRRATVTMRKAFHLIPDEDPMTQADAREDADRVLDTLTPKQRAAVVLTLMLGFTSEEAARVLRVRPSTVRVLVKRARDKLQQGTEAP